MARSGGRQPVRDDGRGGAFILVVVQRKFWNLETAAKT
jgi:hypothetical protein